jgi:hypothetical protein
MNTLQRLARALILAALLLAACASAAPTPAAPPASFWQGWTYTGAYDLEVEPSTALVDAPVSISVAGLQLDQPILVRARMKLGRRTFESFAAFTADSDGVVAISELQLQPFYGTYPTADAMGLFWSMQPVEAEPAAAAGAAANPVGPLTVTVTAEADGQVLATREIQRLFYDEAQVTREEIDMETLAGTLFTPAAPGPHPAVLCLGGSGGDRAEGFAALLASRGYVTLAMPLFGVDPLPAELVEVPLEHFKGALNWLAARPEVDPGRVAVLGGSKGAEAALLLAATYPEGVRAVVGYKPSSVVWMGLPRNPADNFAGPKSSWTKDGQPLPFVSGTVTLDLLKVIAGRPGSLASSYEAGLRDADAVEAAAIRVENIQGPVLLISGGDDQLSPSAHMGEMVMDRLDEHAFAYPHEHLTYAEAGHNLFAPYLPTTLANSGPTLLGGTPEADAAANADAWPKVLAFLEESLQARP